jgi:hypothetical protein
LLSCKTLSGNRQFRLWFEEHAKESHLVPYARVAREAFVQVFRRCRCVLGLWCCSQRDAEGDAQSLSSALCRSHRNGNRMQHMEQVNRPGEEWRAAESCYVLAW